MANFFIACEQQSTPLKPGLSRSIIATGGSLMAVEVSFEEGVRGDLHHHPHEQMTYVLEGTFEFTVGDETKIVTTGDSLYKQPNIEHGCVCLKKGRLLDVFTPQRTDFL